MRLAGVRAAIATGHWPTLLGGWLHLTVSFMVWVLLAGLIVAIGEDLALSPAQQSLLVSLPLFTGAGLRILAGWACDWWGAKSTGIIVLVLQLVGLLWAATGATSYIELLAVGALLGMGGASFAVALPLASRTYPPAHQGLVLGLVASGNIGTVLALALAPLCESFAGWHGAFGLMAWPLCAVLALFILVVQPDQSIQQIR
jgi:NNP family nitrate/nitrite transporter-like MFS transporter